MPTERRIAVACQGGGSHAAFTAGVLKTLVRDNGHGYKLTGFSGTSGGAMSALLAWYGLLTGGVDESLALLDGFWRTNSARLPFETLLNGWTTAYTRFPLEVRGSPYSPPLSWSIDQLKLLSEVHERAQFWGPRMEFVDLEALLAKYVDLDRVKDHTGDPQLLVGAIDINSGEFKAFDSDKGEITVKALLASAALPRIFKAVRIGEHAYWDGLYSQNPPIRDFITGHSLGEKPDEIWIIQINPQEYTGEPTTPEEITDRCNELSGNLSLNQEVSFIMKVNSWLQAGWLPKEEFKTIQVHRIAMSPSLAGALDSSSKLDRSPVLVERLIADGEALGKRFLARWPARRELAPRNGRRRATA
jgi:NTE family protein